MLGCSVRVGVWLYGPRTPTAGAGTGRGAWGLDCVGSWRPQVLNGLGCSKAGAEGPELTQHVVVASAALLAVVGPVRAHHAPGRSHSVCAGLGHCQR